MADVYTRVLRKFCKFAAISDPYALLELGLDKIEKLTTNFIRVNQNALAPKYLNVVYAL